MPQIPRQAEQALENGDFAQAQALLGHHLQSNPLDIRALSLKCHAEIALAEFDTARATAVEIGKIDADSFEFHAAMGAVLTDEPTSPKEIGTVLRAIQHMERAIAIANAQAGLSPLVRSRLHYNLANARHHLYLCRRARPGSSLHDILDSHGDAIADFDAALRANPDNVEAWVNKGNLLDEAGRYVESLDCYLEALRRNSKHSMALGNRGLALAVLALRLPEPYRTRCVMEAGFFLKAALSAGEFGERYKNDGQLRAIVDSVLKLDAFENADDVVTHLMEHMKSPQALPRSLGGVKSSDFSQFADAVVSSLGLRLAFGEDFLLRSALPEDWVDVPFFLSGIRMLRAGERLFLVSLIDRYRTARNLLVLALSDVREFQMLSNPGRAGFPAFSMNEEMLKDSLKSAVDLMDSVAYFLVDVSGLSCERVTFSGPNSLFFKTTLFDDNQENQQLLALASLSREVSRGEYAWLEGFRNARTHEYLLFRGEAEAIEHSRRIDKYHLAVVGEFIERSVQALRIARAAILYTILYVIGLDTLAEDAVE